MKCRPIAWQRGLSLIWCAVLMAVLAYGAMAAIFALRYQRNLLAESWALITRSQAVANVAQSIGSADTAALRKCRINGRVMYSNVACSDADHSTSKLDLVPVRGIEAPKVSTAKSEPIRDATEAALQQAGAGH